MNKVSLVCSILLLSFLFFSTGCSKKEDPAAISEESVTNQDQVESSEGIDKRISQYQASVRKEPELKTWLATLNKGEEVLLLEETTQKVSGKDALIAKVRLSDDSEGYIRADYLALKALVVTVADTALYKRNNSSSGVAATLPIGTVLMVIEEKADWYKVSATPLASGEKIFSKWIKDGFSDEKSLVADAVQMEHALGILFHGNKGDADLARKNLEAIAEKSTVISPVAKSSLDGTGGTTVEEFKYPEGMSLALVKADSGLKLRKDPSTDGEEIILMPVRAKVGIIETASEEVVVAGESGYWYKLNYNGTEGYAFGAFLEFKESDSE